MLNKRIESYIISKGRDVILKEVHIFQKHAGCGNRDAASSQKEHQITAKNFRQATLKSAGSSAGRR